MKTYLGVILVCCLLGLTRAFNLVRTPATDLRNTLIHDASVAQDYDTTSVADENSSLSTSILQEMSLVKSSGDEFAESFGLGNAESAFFSLFTSIRNKAQLGLRGTPFVLRKDEIQNVLGQDAGFAGFFDMNDLEKALSEDFLDASRGSTDNRKAWQITDVSVPRGQSFEEARMTFEDVKKALEKGTVIMNAAGAHIPLLAGPSLACTDATSLPCALNLYVTDVGKRTSAPPHTDKQDVAVVQTSGSKNWKVYSPPDPSRKPHADIFARGKMDDSLPLYALESELGCELLLETTLNPGDVLFIPAGFPHTTSTVTEEEDTEAKTSIHLTLGIDHHIWELDYLSVRRIVLKRAGVNDVLGQQGQSDNPFVGSVNQLNYEVIKDLTAELPLGFVEDGNLEMNSRIVSKIKQISLQIDEASSRTVDDETWTASVDRLQQQGQELFDTHRNMYLAAIDEGKTRMEEDAMTAHLDSSVRKNMTPERMQRLSLFRVKRYFDEIDASKKALLDWSLSGQQASGSSCSSLPLDWALTMPVKVGDKVEADLGGAYFPATVSRASGGTYDVNFFDGDRELGLDRSQIRLTEPPAVEAVDTSGMTPKQLKRWKKQQQQKKTK